MNRNIKQPRIYFIQLNTLTSFFVFSFVSLVLEPCFNLKGKKKRNQIYMFIGYATVSRLIILYSYIPRYILARSLDDFTLYLQEKAILNSLTSGVCSKSKFSANFSISCAVGRPFVLPYAWL